MHKPHQTLLNRSASTLLTTLTLLTCPSALLMGTILPQPSIAQTLTTTERLYQQANPAVVTIKNGSGHGSGFLVSSDGLIITNAHVVADGPRVVTVMFSDGRQAPADVIGFAKGGVDLAALRIYPQKKQPALTLARPDSIRVGEAIFVIGTPLLEEYQNSLSTGIISRLDPKQGRIQHNANTNPGNSGGPVLNAQGQVVGVHFSGDIQAPVFDNSGQTVGRTRSGINFAISVDRLQSFLTAVRQRNISPISTLPKPQQQEVAIAEISPNGQTLRGSLSDAAPQSNDGSYYKLYKFQGHAGQTVTFNLRSDDFNPYLLLYRGHKNEDGTESFEPIAKNDDRGPNDFNAQIVAQLDTDGTYYVMANTSVRGETGRFTLQASATP